MKIVAYGKSSVAKAIVIATVADHRASMPRRRPAA